MKLNVPGLSKDDIQITLRGARPVVSKEDESKLSSISGAQLQNQEGVPTSMRIDFLQKGQQQQQQQSLTIKLRRKATHDIENAKAVVADGILRVVVPKITLPVVHVPVVSRESVAERPSGTYVRGVRQERGDSEQRRQHVLALRDPGHGLDVERMDREDEGHEEAPGSPSGETLQQDEQQQAGRHRDARVAEAREGTSAADLQTRQQGTGDPESRGKAEYDGHDPFASRQGAEAGAHVGNPFFW